MIKKDDLEKLASNMGLVFYALVFIVIARILTFLIKGTTTLVQETYQLGYTLGSWIETLL